MKYRVSYLVPDYSKPSEEWEVKTEVLEFESDLWASDYAYSRADKHWHEWEKL